MNRLQQVGSAGEDAAAAYLSRNGLTVVDRNVRLRGGEIDLVAADRDEMVFVEVKTRIGGQSVAPDESVKDAKLERLGRLAEQYLRAQRAAEKNWRIDVVGVVMSPSGDVIRVDHFVGAFR